MDKIKWALVALPLPVFKLYTYKIPVDFIPIVRPGCRVLVPVRRKDMTGVVTRVLDDPSDEIAKEDIKDIVDVLDDRPLIPEKLLKLLLWASEFFIYPPGQVISSVIPSSLKVKTSYLVIPGDRFEELKFIDAKIYDYFINHKVTKLPVLVRDLKLSYARISYLVNRGFLARKEKKVREKNVTCFYKVIDEDAENLGIVERRIVEFLKGKEWVSRGELRKAVPSMKKKHIEDLIKKKVIKEKKGVLYHRLFWGRDKELYSSPVPAPFQKKAILEIEKAFDEGKFVLLRGYTGSGKTIIYAKLIDNVLSKGKSAILLVPEISLTPQLISFFSSIYGDEVAVLHSGLTESERFSEYMMIRGGKKKVVIGVRSAIFAPLENIGIIIVDEEHETTYKQEEGFIYHTRSIAYKRAEIEGASLLLGSATPSIETYNSAVKGRLKLVEVEERFGSAHLPDVQMIDIRGERLHLGVFTSRLISEIGSRLKKGEQVLLFMNRRGFAPAIICQDCGKVIKCPNCDVPLVFHRQSGKLICHYCDFRMDLPAHCPSCGSVNLKELGSGTERVEEVTKITFPTARVGRFDRDSMTNRKKYEELIRQMESGEIDILVGTQMITKGLHFENVTLSGVVLADQSLFIPDFRAVEHTYQLITQIMGRSGRGKKSGIALIQTYNPDHYVFKYIGEENYREFFSNEMKVRQEGKYPPFSRLLLFLLSAPSADDAEKYADLLARELIRIKKSENLKFQMLGPGENPIFYLRRRYRFNILLKSDSYRSLQKVGKIIFEGKNKLFPPSVRIKINLDPYVFI